MLTDHDPTVRLILETDDRYELQAWREFVARAADPAPTPRRRRINADHVIALAAVIIVLIAAIAAVIYAPESPATSDVYHRVPSTTVPVDALKGVEAAAVNTTSATVETAPPIPSAGEPGTPSSSETGQQPFGETETTGGSSTTVVSEGPPAAPIATLSASSTAPAMTTHEATTVASTGLTEAPAPTVSPSCPIEKHDPTPPGTKWSLVPSATGCTYLLVPDPTPSTAASTTSTAPTSTAVPTTTGASA